MKKIETTQHGISIATTDTKRVRRKKEIGTRHIHRVSVFLTDTQEQRLREMSSHAGMSVSAWMRAMIMSEGRV